MALCLVCIGSVADAKAGICALRHARACGVLIRDPFLSVCQVHIVSRHGKSRCPTPAPPIRPFHSIGRHFCCAVRPLSKPPAAPPAHPQIFGKPKKMPFRVSGPALSHSTLPDTARSLCFGPNPAASSAIPVTGSILCISECAPGIGVSYHGCFVIIGRLLAPQDKMCCLAGCFRFPLANFCMHVRSKADANSPHSYSPIARLIF